MTLPTTATPISLPAGFRIRPLTLDDVPAIVELYAAYDRSFGSEPTLGNADLINYWKSLDLPTQTWGIENAAGQIIASEELSINKEQFEFEIDGVVHPEYLNLGLGSFLVDTAETRIQELFATLESDKAVIEVGINGKDLTGADLFLNRGYKHFKNHTHMQITLTELPAEPIWAEGITVRSWVRGQDDREIYEVVETAFNTIPDRTPLSFEDWSTYMLAREDIDPTLYFLALKDGKIIGTSLCPHDREIGWVRQLAVLPEYHGLGLGKALLQHSFREWYLRGKPTVGLGVQNDNHKAMSLYTSMGMEPVTVFDSFRKEITK